jgi:hypothetical protein
VFTNSIGPATSTAATLTVVSDIIFQDDFNSCNASAWTGGTINAANLAFNIASGRNSTCGMAVTLANSIAAYAIDPSPSAETRLNARFYFNQNTLRLAKNDLITVFAANNTTGQDTVTVQIRYTSNAFQLRAGLLRDGRKWSYTTWSTISNGWHSVEFNWTASSAAGANNGGLIFWIDGAQAGLLNAMDNDQQKIDSATLGIVAGMDNTTLGTYNIDDYVSHRLTYIGP